MSAPPYYQVPGGDSGHDLFDLFQALPPPLWLQLLPARQVPVACYLALDTLIRAWRANHPAKHCTVEECVRDYNKIAVSATRLAALLSTARIKEGQ